MLERVLKPVPMISIPIWRDIYSGSCQHSDWSKIDFPPNVGYIPWKAVFKHVLWWPQQINKSTLWHTV